MSRRGGSSSANGIQLLPFLDILTCTMGALVTLLFAFARYGQQQVVNVSDAKQVAAEAAAADEIEDLEWRASMLRESRDKTEANLGEARLELSHLEDHLRRLRQRAEQLHQAAIALENADPKASEAKTDAELAKLKQRITLTAQELELARKNAAGRSTTYSIVPYAGPNQTRRRPIYIECRAEGVVLEPEGIVFSDNDFAGPLGPGNPLAAAVRAAREYMESKDPDSFDKVEPYPLLVVRPDAIPQYYAARSALMSFGSQFGYELIGADKQLKFPEADPQMGETINSVVAEARVRQAQLIAAAPRRYRNKSKPTFHVKPGGGGIEREPEPRTAQNDRNPYAGIGRRGSGGGRGNGGNGPGGNGAGGTSTGTSTGTTTGTSTGTTTGTGRGTGDLYAGGDGAGGAGGTGAGGAGSGGGDPLGVGNIAGGGESDGYGNGTSGSGGNGTGTSGSGANGTGTSGSGGYGTGAGCGPGGYGTGALGPGGYGTGGGPNGTGGVAGGPGGYTPGGGGGGGGGYGPGGLAGGASGSGYGQGSGGGPGTPGGVPGAGLTALAGNGGAAGAGGGPGGAQTGAAGSGDQGGAGQGNTDGNGGDGTGGKSPGSPGQGGAGAGGGAGGRVALAGTAQPDSNGATDGAAGGSGTALTTTLQGTGGSAAGSTQGNGSGTGPGGGGLGGLGGNPVGGQAGTMPTGPQKRGNGGGAAVPNTRVQQATNASGHSIGGGADDTGPSNSTPSGGSMASGGSANNGSAGSSGGTNSGGTSGGSSSPGGQQSAIGMPNLNFGQQPQDPTQGRHGKKNGGQNRPPGWGLPDAPATSASVARPVVIECWSDKLVMIGDDGKSVVKQIPLTQHTEDAIDELVSSVWQQMKQWGAAGKGLTWRPTLTMRVAPDAHPRFEELQTLLADSGLEVKESTHKLRTASKSWNPLRK